MKKTVIITLLACTAYNLEPSFGARFGGTSPNTAPEETSQYNQPAVKKGSGFGARFGGATGGSSALPEAHHMTGAADPAAKQALKQGGPIGLARYMVRKIADALGYNTQEMIDLVQSAMSGHGTSELPPVKAKKTTKKATAPVAAPRVSGSPSMMGSGYQPRF